MTKIKEEAIENFKKSLEVSKELKQEVENEPDNQPDSGFKITLINGVSKEVVITEWIISALTAIETENDLKDAVIAEWLFGALNNLCETNKNNFYKYSKIKGILKTKDYENVELANEELRLALDVLNKEDNKSIEELVSNEIKSSLEPIYKTLYDLKSRIDTYKEDTDNRITNSVLHIEDSIKRNTYDINSVKVNTDVLIQYVQDMIK